METVGIYLNNKRKPQSKSPPPLTQIPTVSHHFLALTMQQQLLWQQPLHGLSSHRPNLELPQCQGSAIFNPQQGHLGQQVPQVNYLLLTVMKDKICSLRDQLRLNFSCQKICTLLIQGKCLNVITIII